MMGRFMMVFVFASSPVMNAERRTAVAG